MVDHSLSGMEVVTHEDYLAAITAAVCAQFPATADALNQVHLVFGSGPRRRAACPLCIERGAEGRRSTRCPWSRSPRSAVSPPETCHVVPHELAHILAPGMGHNKAWHHAARQVGLMRPRARPEVVELSDWSVISPKLCTVLQAIPVPTEPALAEYRYDWQRRPCGAGYGSRGGSSRGEGSGSRYLPAPRLRLPGAGDSQVAGARRAVVSGRGTRPNGARIHGSGPSPAYRGTACSRPHARIGGVRMNHSPRASTRLVGQGNHHCVSLSNPTEDRQ